MNTESAQLMANISPAPTIAFADGFAELTDQLHPYPWQHELFKRMISNDWPSALDVPTGLGKTNAVIAWLLAHLIAIPECRPPMRLIYVVNRRTIVDQASDIAVQLRKRLHQSSLIGPIWRERFGNRDLAVSTLRGALADNREWLDTPSCPAIVVGTVDMIGSRLLFNGYRVGRWQLARHAGLLGYDSLLIHDEAHLSQPFQSLLQWITSKQEINAHGLRVLPMSATGSSEADMVLRISDTDRAVPSAMDKLSAKKRIFLVEPQQKKLHQILVQLALQHEASASRIIIFVREPQEAQKVYDELTKKVESEDRVELLTGTQRGCERDVLINKPVLQHLLKRTTPERTVYLVSTSAGEIGADFDADHLVCDLSTIESLIQRLGRVNRQGGNGRSARIDLVMSRPNKKNQTTPYQMALMASASFLESLAKEQGGSILSSPDAVSVWREMPGYAAACTPPVPTIMPHDVVLDAWSLTSIQDPWPLALDVHPFLHGLKDELPETYVAWRTELDLLPCGDKDNENNIGEILNCHPLRPREVLRDKPEIVAALLTKMQQYFPEKQIAIIHTRAVNLKKVSDLPRHEKEFAALLGYKTVILPPSAGGLSARGTIDVDAIGPNDLLNHDVADDVSEDRARVLLTRSTDNGWLAKRLHPADAPNNENESWFPTWVSARNELARLYKMRHLKRLILSHDGEGEPVVMLLLYVKPTTPARQNNERVTVDEHNSRTNSVINGLFHESPFSIPELTALRFAAQNHDLGKCWAHGDGCWQQAIGNTDKQISLAKSFNNGFKPRLLKGYRHEFGSLVSAVQNEQFSALDEPTQDLALHLIASHHGRGRPHFNDFAVKTPVDLLPDALKPDEIARRFDRLQRRYGYWGLAWLEAVFMAADAQSSCATNSEPGEDEEQNGDDE